MQVKTFVASAIISELQSSDIYLTVKARLFDLNANLNGVRVTAAFLDEIVNNEEKYVGIPLCADVRGLLANETIGHMYDRRTGEFHSTAIGSFYHFEKEVQGENTYMVGYARIMKRNKAVCNAITQLFASNTLKFSFEISCGDYTEDENGIIVIDASEHNFLQGAAVVTFPACEQAVALQLVAECLKGDENMADEILEQEIVAQVEQKEETAEVVAEDTTEEKEQETEHEQVAQTEDVPAQTAETVAAVQEEDDDTSQPEDDKEDQEEETAECKKDEQSACDEKQNAELSKYDTLIAQLNEKIAQLVAEVNSIKSSMEQTAQAATETQNAEETAQAHDEVAEVVAEKTMREQIISNPFMAEMSTPTKYSLLGKNERISSYSLLDRR